MSLCSKKREREKMKNRLCLGSGSELCVAVPSASPCCALYRLYLSLDRLGDNSTWHGIT